MWLADQAPDVVGANLYLVLYGAVTTVGGIVLALLDRRRRKTAKNEIDAAVDDALETQDRMVTQPIARERDDYRERWQRCIEGKLRGRRDD